MTGILDVCVPVEGVDPDQMMARWLAEAERMGVAVGEDDMTELLAQGLGVVTFEGERYVIDILPYADSGAEDSQAEPQQIRARELREGEWRVRSVRNEPLAGPDVPDSSRRGH